MKNKLKTLLLLFAIFFVTNLYGQETHNDIFKILYTKFASGQVKVADFNFGKTQEDFIVRSQSEVPELIAMVNFFKENFGLKGVIITEEQRQGAYRELASYCEVVNVNYEIGSFKSELGAVGYYPLKLNFSFCDSTALFFDVQINVTGLTKNLTNAVKRTLIKNFPKPTKVNYPDLMSLKSNELLFTDTNNLVQYFKKNINKSTIEGVYKLFSTNGRISIKKFGLVSSGVGYNLVNLETNYFQSDWKFGEIRGEFNPSISNKILTGKLQSTNKRYTDATLTFIDENIVELEWYGNPTRFRFVKIDPNFDKY